MNLISVSTLWTLACEQARHLWWAKRAARGGDLSFPAPRTRISFRVLLSRDFSRLPQMESMLAGYLNFDNFLFGPPKQRL